MPLTPEQRARYEQIRDQGLKFVDTQASTIANAPPGARVDVEFRYLVLNAAAAALDLDDRERDARERTREVRATLAVAAVAALATAVQAVAMVVEACR